jgi:hypothetical protein
MQKPSSNVQRERKRNSKNKKKKELEEKKLEGTATQGRRRTGTRVRPNLWPQKRTVASHATRADRVGPVGEPDEDRATVRSGSRKSWWSVRPGPDGKFNTADDLTRTRKTSHASGILQGISTPLGGSPSSGC